MKKAIVYLLLLTFLLSFFSSCTKTPEKSETDSQSPTEQTESTPIINESSNRPSANSSNNENEEKYSAILDIYDNVVINLDEYTNAKPSPYGKETQEYEWWSAILSAVASFHTSSQIPSYAFCNLNQSQGDELLLLLDDYTVLAIFSCVNNQPILLDNYWNRKKCTIDGDGRIEVYGSNGSASTSFSMFKISDDDETLVLLEEYGTNGYDANTYTTYYYKLSNGNKVPITALEYTASLSQGTYSSIEELAKHTKQNVRLDLIPVNKEFSLKRIFESILNYNTQVTSVYKYLYEYSFSFSSNKLIDFETVEICYLDMDNDGSNELILRSNIHDYLILRYYESKVYLYEFSYKAMDRIYEDGSFSWNAQTYLADNSVCYGKSMLTFDKSTAYTKSLYTIYDGENESYFTINERLVTKSELDAYIEARKNIKEVEWTTFSLNKKNISAKG